MTATYAGRACCIPASDSFRSIRRSEGMAESGIGGGLRATSPRNGRPPPVSNGRFAANGQEGPVA